MFSLEFPIKLIYFDDGDNETKYIRNVKQDVHSTLDRAKLFTSLKHKFFKIYLVFIVSHLPDSGKSLAPSLTVSILLYDTMPLTVTR